MRAKKELKQLEEEEVFATTKRSMDNDPPKQHFSNTENNFLSRKKAPPGKKNDEFDDILSALDAIDNTTTENKKAKTLTSFQPKNNNAYDNFFDQKQDDK